MRGPRQAQVSMLLLLLGAMLVSSALSGASGTGGAPTISGVASVPSPATVGPSTPLTPGSNHGIHVVDTITVGLNPMGLAYDPAAGEVFVANGGSNNVSVINDTSDHVVANIPVGRQPGYGPESVAYDPASQLVFVANFQSKNLSVLNGSTNTVVSTVPLTGNPTGVAYDAANHLLYVTELPAALVAPVSTRNPAGPPIPVGSPWGIAYDPVQGELWVSQAASGAVAIVNASRSSMTGSILLGAPPPPGVEPEGVAYDAGRGETFVVNFLPDNVSIVDDTTNRIAASVVVGNDPVSPAYDAATGDVYVTDSTGDNVTVINDTSDRTIANVSVGFLPYGDAWDSGRGEVFVTNNGSDNVTVLSQTPRAGQSVIFTEAGLPAGKTWSVTGNSPPLTVSNTTYAPKSVVRARGVIPFTAPLGLLTFRVRPPAGWGVVRASGRTVVSSTSVKVLGLTRLTIVFGADERYYFNESLAVSSSNQGLPPGTSWGITLTAVGTDASPAPPAATTTGNSVNFTVPAGAVFHFAVAKPSTYRATPAHGSFTVPPRTTTRVIVFRLITVRVVFRESGLPKGTLWGVNVTGPMPRLLSGRTSALTTVLENGSYSYALWNFTSLHPHPPSGTLSISAPHARLTVSIVYNTTLAPLRRNALANAGSTGPEPASGPSRGPSDAELALATARR